MENGFEQLSARAAIDELRTLRESVARLELANRTWSALLDGALPPKARLCPICNTVQPEFTPFGLIPRQDACCPSCRTVERHRLAWLYMRMNTNLFTSKLRFLHFAPEPGFREVLRRSPELTYVSVDIEPGKADEVADIQNLPYAEGSFDAIFCSHVLEHIPDDRRAMRELYRVLAKGGWAIVMVPLESQLTATREDPSVTSPEERMKHYGSPEHVRMYSLDVADRLREAGFRVSVNRSFADRLDPALRRRLAVLPDWIFHCVKE